MSNHHVGLLPCLAVNLIAHLIEINILLDFSTATDLLELKKTAERLDLELLLLELLSGTR